MTVPVRASVHRVLALLVLALAFLASPAQARWLEGDAISEGREWQKSDGEFGAMLVITGDPDDLLQAWERGQDNSPLPTIGSVTAGGIFAAFVIFTGCEPDYRGACDATVDYVVMRPDGSEYARFIDGELWRLKPPPPTGTLELGIDYIGIESDPTEPLGGWTVRALVRDRIATRLLELIREVEIVAPR